MERRQRLLRPHSYSMVVRAVAFVVQTAPAVSRLSALIAGMQIVAPLALLVITERLVQEVLDGLTSRLPVQLSRITCDVLPGWDRGGGTSPAPGQMVIVLRPGQCDASLGSDEPLANPYDSVRL